MQRLFLDGLNNHDTSVVNVVADLLRDCVYHMPQVGELRDKAGQFYGSILTAFPDAAQ